MVFSSFNLTNSCNNYLTYGKRSICDWDGSYEISLATNTKTMSELLSSFLNSLQVKRWKRFFPTCQEEEELEACILEKTSKHTKRYWVLESYMPSYPTRVWWAEAIWFCLWILIHKYCLVYNEWLLNHIIRINLTRHRTHSWEGRHTRFYLSNHPSIGKSNINQ